MAKKKMYRAAEGAPPPATAKKHGTETPKLHKPFKYAAGSKNRTKS